MALRLAGLCLLASLGAVDAGRRKWGPLGASQPSAASAGRRNGKPHIVMILADDLGWTNIGYSAKRGMREVGPEKGLFEAEADFTPHIDKLATADGVVLTRHYSYTACTPSRQSVLNGRLPVRNGVLLGEIFMWDGGVNRTWGYEGAPIVPNASSIAKKFKEVGYYTAVVGKVDGYGNDTPEHLPKGRGFDESLVLFHHGTDNWNYAAVLAGAGAIPPCSGEWQNPVIDMWENDGPFKDARRLSQVDNPENSDSGTGKHKEEIFLERALNIVEEHAAKRPGQPLFLKYWPTLVHTPLQVPKAYLDSTADMMCEWNPGCLDWRGRCSLREDVGGSADGFCALEERLQLLAMSRMLDDHVGAMRAALEAAGMWQDTLLVFASDNGGGIGVGTGGNNWPLRGGKGSDWEGGSRTLAFVSGGYLPEQVRGTEMNQVMHIVDWYATLLGLAGAHWQTDNLDGVIGPVDSKDYWPAISGSHSDEVRDELHLSPWSLMQRQEDGHWLKIMTQVQGFTMWTGPDYPNNTDAQRPNNPAPIGPVSLPHDCNEGCLFDLDADPFEYTNLNQTEELSTLFRSLVGRLSQLNEEQYTEPWRGCLVDTYSCETARAEYDSHYGPFINIDCPTCVNEEYFRLCDATQRDEEPPFGCVPRSRNECNCQTGRFGCLIASGCSWNNGVCELTPQLQGRTRAQVALATMRTSGSASANFRLGATLDS